MSISWLLGTVGGMTSDDLTPAQLRMVGEVVGRHLAYLTRLTRRMQELGFTDDVYAAACKARDATHTSSVKLHYASCDFVGRPPTPHGNGA